MSITSQAPRRNSIPLLVTLLAGGISLCGSVLSMIALPWFVLETTGSATKTGVVAASATLPVIIGALFGGAVVDRIGYKLTSVIADLGSAVMVALIPLLYRTGVLGFWQLIVLVFCNALLNSPGATARAALLPELAALAGWRLERATAASQAVERGSRLCAAPLAGLLTATLGPTGVLWVDAATFLISAVLLAIAIPTSVCVERPAQPKSYRAEMAAGLRFIWQDKFTRSICAIVVILSVLDAPLFSVIMPVYANRVLGNAVDLGLIVAAFAGGSLIGVLGFGAVGHRVPRHATFIGAFVLAGAPFWILTTLASLPVVLVALFLVGFASGPLNPLLRTVGYERVPAELRGRVFGTVAACMFAAMPVGLLLAGLLLDKIGLRYTLMAIASTYSLVVISLFFNSSLRELNQPQQLLAKAPGTSEESTASAADVAPHVSMVTEQ